ncbi:ABC transporter permease [Aliikangiella coralliicola]|uniref:FtsX-like permease family protein n=1 Tax=Aliikangiella coralliicola TaxID=2592383 RepID=A0A545UGX8_9GAMM|nr:ABC transporter permease [Aliikangiella coralliicola]TQV88722.1 FtsX-like permease family protein [Aliikangiella coralliicola]
MFLYSLKLAKANLKNRPGLTLLTISAIAIGLALLTTTTTMSYQSSKIPLLEESEKIQTVLIDSRDQNARDITDVRRTPRLTYQDTQNLFTDATFPVEKTYLWKSFTFLNDENGDAHPRQVRTMAGLSNFFTMFKVPFLYGSGWSKADDENATPVIVLSYKMNQHFFGGENSVGKTIRINSSTLTVVGVLANWKLAARFYDRSFSTARFDDVFVPSSLALEINIPRRISCWEKDSEFVQDFSRENVNGLKASECTWLNLWVKLEDENQAKQYIDYLAQYVSDQKSFGRFPREHQPTLLSIKEYSELNSTNNTTLFIFALLSVLFFLVCLINTVGILLAKYMGKVPEIALRRALGAKKHVILMQYLIEIGLISFIGGVVGVILSYFGLKGMMKVYIYQSDYTVTADAIQHLYQLDWIMISQALLIAVGSSLIVSLYPVWKMCNTAPAGHLKAQ